MLAIGKAVGILDLPGQSTEHTGYQLLLHCFRSPINCAPFCDYSIQKFLHEFLTTYITRSYAYDVTIDMAAWKGEVGESLISSCSVLLDTRKKRRLLRSINLLSKASNHSFAFFAREN
ncbi:hypothetical protein ACMFMF_002681 [Clarireedia jacksonii]